MNARPLIRQYEAVQAMSVVDTTKRVTELTRELASLNLEGCHFEIIGSRLATAATESQLRNDDQTGFDVLADLFDRIHDAAQDIKTFDVPAMARASALDCKADEKVEQRRCEA